MWKKEPKFYSLCIQSSTSVRKHLLLGETWLWQHHAVGILFFQEGERNGVGSNLFLARA